MFNRQKYYTKLLKDRSTTIRTLANDGLRYERLIEGIRTALRTERSGAFLILRISELLRLYDNGE